MYTNSPKTAENSIVNGPDRVGDGNIPMKGDINGWLMSYTHLTKGAAVEAPINLRSIRNAIAVSANPIRILSIPRIMSEVIILNLYYANYYKKVA